MKFKHRLIILFIKVTRFLGIRKKPEIVVGSKCKFYMNGKEIGIIKDFKFTDSNSLKMTYKLDEIPVIDMFDAKMSIEEMINNKE